MTPSSSGGVSIRQVEDKDPWGQCYEFVAGDLVGLLAPRCHSHGVVALKHAGDGEDIVQQGRCFLNAEYYLSPNTPAHMDAWAQAEGQPNAYLSRAIPRTTSQFGLTTARIDGNRFVIHFPPDRCPADIEIELDLIYEPRADNKIDFTFRVTPKVDVAGFEIFSANYVADRMGKTCVPYRGPGGEKAWDRFAKHQAVGRSGTDCYFYVRDDRAAAAMTDGRHPLDFGPWTRPRFALPIIAAISDADYVLSFFVDPKWCAAVGGQHHADDTALDWSIATDLEKGRPWTVQTRMHYDRMTGSLDDKYRRIEALYEQFLIDIGRAVD